MIKLFLFEVNDMNEDILLDKMSLLSYEEKEKVSKYKYNKDRALSLAGRLLLLCFANRYKSDDYSDVNYIDDLDEFDERNINDLSIEYDSNGKGFIKNRENLYYNISHSGNISACVLSDVPVGVDIQNIRKVNEKIARRFFGEKDCEYIFDSKDCSEEEMNKKITYVWSAKESFVKLTGRGIAGGMDDFFEDFDKMIVCDCATGLKKADLFYFKTKDNYHCFVSY